MLARLLNDVSFLGVLGDRSVSVQGICSDSRSVRPGDVFVACRGQKADGRQFVPAAVEKGAAAVVCEPPAPEGVTVPVVLVEDARRALAELAASFYGHPSRTLGLVGVTGTDGKTTTTHLIAAILNGAGVRTGLISTVELHRGQGVERNRTSQTTPEAPIIQRSLAAMGEAGIAVAVLEVSSHALETARVHRCVFDCAVFTNLSPEHLDFHQTLRNYRAAKAKLFAQLDVGPAKPWGRLAVVNRDDPSSAAMRAACSVPAVDYGLSGEATIRATVRRMSLDGTTFRVRTPEGDATIQTSLTGRYNVLNWLAAIAAARHFGATLADVQRAAATFRGVPGRLEPVRCGQPFRVFVDFAHTPQALQATLSLLRQHTDGRLIALFGQAGHRDVGNRVRMAEAVARNADLAIVTSDDPYDDDPQAIVDDLGRALRELGWREGAQFWRVVDRVEAILLALRLARRGDTVLLAGRGPEEETVVGGRRIPLIDAEVARHALAGHAAA